MSSSSFKVFLIAHTQSYMATLFVEFLDTGVHINYLQRAS